MLIDANVFKGYFQLEIGKPHSLNGCPRALMNTVSPTNPVYHDTGGIVEHEWRSVVDQEWFDAWLSANLQSGAVEYLPPTRIISLEKKLKGLGFPAGRDIVYVRVGLSVAEINGSCFFYTEDLDFYDPKLKSRNSATRIKALSSSVGPVSKLLAGVCISVRCVP